jgi:hypothetical protein
MLITGEYTTLKAAMASRQLSIDAFDSFGLPDDFVQYIVTDHQGRAIERAYVR